MNVDAKKVELMDWIAKLKDERALGKLLALKKRLSHGNKSRSKIFGSGKHLIEYIDDNFNEPLEMFDAYKK